MEQILFESVKVIDTNYPKLKKKDKAGAIELVRANYPVYHYLSEELKYDPDILVAIADEFMYIKDSVNLSRISIDTFARMIRESVYTYTSLPFDLKENKILALEALASPKYNTNILLPHTLLNDRDIVVNLTKKYLLVNTVYNHINKKFFMDMEVCLNICLNNNDELDRIPKEMYDNKKFVYYLIKWEIYNWAQMTKLTKILSGFNRKTQMNWLKIWIAKPKMDILDNLYDIRLCY